MVEGVLAAKGMREALQGKLLISIVAGWTTAQLKDAISIENSKIFTCSVVRAMPNTAAAVRESMTVIEQCEPALPSQYLAVVDWMFEQVGEVAHLPSSQLDACTALCGSTPAFFAVVVESLIDGAVAMGLPRVEAKRFAFQAMRGTAGLLQAGEHPAVLKEKVSSPGGCTIGGLMVLEEGAVRGTVAKAVREAATIASLLGQGLQGVNGTRH